MGVREIRAVVAAVVWLAAPALAAEAPTQFKAGGWEATGSTNMPALGALNNPGRAAPKTQICLDDETASRFRRALVVMLGAIDPEDLPKGTVTTTATGFTVTSVDTQERQTSSFTAEVTGDAEHHRNRVLLQTTPSSVVDGELITESLWLGACPAGLKPGQWLAAGEVRELSEYANVPAFGAPDR